MHIAKSKGNSAIIILLITLAIISALIFLYRSKTWTPEKESAEQETMMEEKDVTMVLGFSGNILAGKIAPLIDFNKVDYEQAIASDKLVVLYFYATWCPICKAELPHLYGAFNELATDQIIGFRVNYNDSDTDSDEKELAREFGVAYQHTKVFLKNGERILKSPETWNENRYLEEITKRI